MTMTPLTMTSLTTATPTYTDFSGLNEMRANARVDPQASLKQVAKQFEGIFIQMMLKSMRDASMGDEIFDSDQSKLYRDMFDKQVALDMANNKGIGIADSLVRQLSKNVPDKAKAEQVDLHSLQATRGNILPFSAERMQTVDQDSVRGLSPYELPSIKPIADKTQFNTTEEFTSHILPYAEKAAKELGVSPLVLVAQAALETGWGKAVTRHQDGSSSFNLFNIKADKRWDGEHVIKSTLEYDNGHAKYEKASFRAYDSYADSFDDYVNFLRTNSRYGDALRHDGNDQLYIEDLHKAGYATDPDYADKVLNILSRESIQAHADTEIDSSSSNGQVS
ncbi:MAG: flagellar assembly peptidoglycan hydrolase FlgJ [Gammaproteobacteria bacterium]|nr:flagellar assembly peptidoglycan hydrolase FlgJ [Gammaproteobacteria bacterium]